MDASLLRLRRHAANLFPVLIALMAGPGILSATNLLTATPSTISLSCSTATGPSAAVNITIKSVTPLTGSNTITVSAGSTTGGVVVTPPSAQILNATNTASSGTGLVYAVSLASGCASVTTAAPTFHFNAGSTSDVTITVNTTLVATTSGLVANPNPVTLSCTKSGSTYTPGSSQTVSVTSTAPGGTAFTVDTVTSAPAAWAVVNPTTGGTATSSAVTFTVTAAAGCGSFAVGTTNTTTIHLLNSPAPDKLVTVSLQIVSPTPLTATPSPATLSYVKGSGTAGKVDVNVTAGVSPAPFFSVDTSTLPIWLTVDSTTGTAPKSLRFSSTNVADTLAPGTYSASIHLKVSGYGDLSVPISLLITNKAPKLSVAEGTTRNISWTIGQAIPTPVITAVSTDTPIPYTITTGGTLAPSVPANQQSGLAYSFGSQINVSFNSLVFAAASPGNTLTGTVTLTWGSPASTIVVTFNVTVLSPGATANGLSPASLPTAASGSVFTVSLTGTGFVPSTDPTQKTKVGVVVSGSLVADTNIAANIVNPSNITLTITVPAVADANLPFSPTGTGGSVTLGVCNPVGGTCSIPTGTVVLSIGANPIVQAITSSSSLLQVSAPAVQTVSPYDMVSIFGANFCSSSNTGCSSSQVLFGTPDAVTYTYPTSLSPDAAGSTQRLLTVAFLQHGSSTVLANAPIMFATNSQINLMVPSGVAAQIGNQVDVVVSFGYGTGATMKSSAPFTVGVVATNPGIFTIGADGQGDGAALDNSYALISTTNPGGMRSTATDSDTVQLYMTGLGVPDSTGDNSTAGSAYVWATDCASISSYLTSFNSQTGNALTSLDGTLILPSVLNTNRLPPCVDSGSTNVPTVTVGGVAGTVQYGGWVVGTVAGLYQLNVRLPGSTAGPFTNSAGQAVSTVTAPVQLPVVVTANGKTSQAGVNLWVTPRLKLTGPSGSGLTGTVGTVWSSSNNTVTATEGTSPYRYAVTSGLLPSGLLLNAGTGAITGTPAANTAGSYTITVTGTDSANVPVKGTTTFTLTIAGGLFLTSSGTAPYNAAFGTASPSLTTVTASSGVYPYAFSITSPATLPTGMTIGATSGVLGTTALTPAGTYHVTVTVMDSTSGTPLTSTITFDVVVALHVTRTNPVAGTAGSASTITTVTATGNTGTVTYALDTATAALGWVTINSGTGVVAVTTGSVAGTRSVTVTATDDTAPSNASAAGTGSVTFTMTIN